MKTLNNWSVDDFKDYTKKCVTDHHQVSPSAVVLRSFYIAEVEKPKEVTIQQFEYLRSIAAKTIKDFKSQSNANIT